MEGVIPPQQTTMPLQAVTNPFGPHPKADAIRTQVNPFITLLHIKSSNF